MKYDYYISGPMTGYPEYNYPAFRAMASRLRVDGHACFDPSETFGGKTDLPRHEYMRMDVQALLESKAVIMLKGWSKSRGALLEHEIALELGLPIEYPSGESYPINETVLDEAKRIVYGERNEAYGDPSDDFANIAAIWSVIFNQEVTRDQVGLAMIALKMSRQLHKHKRDNLVDIAGYAACLERC